MTERDRIILGMSPIERAHFISIGGVIPLAVVIRKAVVNAGADREVAAMQAAIGSEDRDWRSKADAA